jgi:pimeloyl-ACP methyl ester carboxylesterase
MIFNFLGVSVFYEVFNPCATGEPVVFLHGWGGSTKSFEFFAKNMGSARPFVLLDFPPFGASSAILNDWTVPIYAQMVSALLFSLKIEKYSIVAHSFGGRVALNLASNEAKNVSKMVLTGCAGLKRWSIKSLLKIRLYKLLKLFVRLRLLSAKAIKNFGSQDYKSLSESMKKTFVNVVNYNSKQDIKKVTCPTLLFWGTKDNATPFCFTKYFKKHIKDCEIIKTNGTHFAYIENAQMFLAVLQNFFNTD